MAADGFTLGLLAASAFLAGAMNAVAGGGTLLTFPALSSVLSLAASNATSTIALLPGSLAGAWGYRKELEGSLPFLRLLLLPSILGGLLGSLLVVNYPEDFGRLVPWLILTAAMLFLVQQPLNRYLRRRRVGLATAEAGVPPHGWKLLGLITLQFLTATYGGYFGAGIGILMLTSLGFMNIGDIHRMNAVKTVLASTINLITVGVFLIANVSSRVQFIHWGYALLMAFSATLGGYLGARVARRMPVTVVRVIIIAIAFTLAAYYFLKLL